MSENKLVIKREQVKDFTQKVCSDNHFSEDFFEDFWKRLSSRDDIYTEYVYYLVKHDFLNKVSVEGYHVIDIFIWQMDRFKAQMDQDTYDTRHNEAVMILNSFDIFLKMAENPADYIHRMQSDTGTDYPEKF